MLLQLEKNQEILPSRLDEALFHCGVLRQIPPSLLSLERVLEPLRQQKKFPNVPVSTREDHRGFRHNSRSTRFPSSCPLEGPLPCFVGKGIPAFLLHLKRRRSQLDTREELQGLCHHFKRPLMSQCIPDTPNSPALTPRSPRGWTPNTMAGVTALWRLEKNHRSLWST